MGNKRIFERRDGMLIDRYVTPSGRRCEVNLSAARLGEALSEGDRAALLATTRSGGSNAPRGLGREASPEHLDALLAGLVDNIGAPMPLLSYLDDPRVRPALVRAARAQQPGGGSNHLQALALMGGVEARAALGERMRLLRDDPATWVDDSFFNMRAGDLCVASCGLVRLDADEIESADCLVRLTRHPCAFNRSRALADAAEFVHHRLQTEAMRRLGDIFLALDLSLPGQEFAAALHALMVLRPEPTLDRCRAILAGEDQEARQAVVFSILRLPLSVAPLSDVVRWVTTEQDVRSVLGVAALLQPALPAGFVENLVGLALASDSPSLRHAGIGVGAGLRNPARRELAAEALLDEPDPALQLALRQLLGE